MQPDRQEHDETASRTRSARCEVHGEYTSRRINLREGALWTDCGRCAFAEQASIRAREVAEEKEAQDRLQRQDWLAKSGVVGRYLDVSFDNFEASNPDQVIAVQAFRKYAANLRDHWRPLLALGLPGCGKTHLASALVRESIAQGRRALLVTPAEMARAIRTTWRKGCDSSESEVIAQFGRVGLLVMDDLGCSVLADHEAAYLFEVLDARYRWRLPTVVSSNLKATELRTAIGDRSFDRLREDHVLVNFNWDSYRAGKRRSA